MSAWPGNPICSVTVTRTLGDPSSHTSFVVGSANTHQSVANGQLLFSIAIALNDPNGYGCSAMFVAELRKLVGSTWVPTDMRSKALSNALYVAGTITDTLQLTVGMTDTVEQYQIFVRCAADDTAYSSLSEPIRLQATRRSSLAGAFQLNYVPISIVYCPPGQDMTNSLTQSRSFGTRISLDSGGVLESTSSSSQSASPQYLVNVTDGSSSSQSGARADQSDIEISHNSNTVITADNQRSIGRAYWGPLGDLFVIAANIGIELVNQHNDDISFGPVLDGGEQVLVIPAWKLIRPAGDSIASLIPEDVRRSILSLDPFITNLDLFFPDSGADISEAANPFIDPSANSRAELIGRWWLDSGTELNYSFGETYVQQFSNTNELSQTLTSKNFVSDGNTGILAELDANVTLTYQQSAETELSTIVNAACFLIRNQNDRDLDGIAVWYDKIFSTFMFQRLRSGPSAGDSLNPKQWRWVGIGALLGMLVDWQNIPVHNLKVLLVGPDGEQMETTSDMNGRYSFYSVKPGRYTLAAGDLKVPVAINRQSSPLEPTRLNLKSVRRVTNIRTAPIWEVAEVLQISEGTARAIGPRIAHLTNERALMRLAGIDSSSMRLLKKRAVLTWSAAKARRVARTASASHRRQDLDKGVKKRARGDRRPAKKKRNPS